MIPEAENTPKKCNVSMNNLLLKVLSIRSFLFLFFAEIFSQVAINMMNFILIIVVFELTSSNTAVSGVVLAFTIPAILFGVFAGVYVDRRDKKTVLVMTNVIRALLLLTLAWFHSSILLLYVATLLITIVTQFFIPAETPMIPLLVKKKLLLSANALFGMGIYGSVLAAYALSGPFLIFFRETYIFVVLAALFLVAASFSWLIKVPLGKKKPTTGIPEQFNMALKDEIKIVFDIMVKTKDIYQSLFLLAFSQVIILIIAVVGPGYASQILDIEVNKFPLFFVTPAALGMFLGSIILGNFFHARAKKTLTTIGIFLSGVGILLLPYGSKVASRDFVHSINAYLPHFLTIDILHIMIFLAFILGIANALVFVPSNAILQEKTTDEIRGRVYGALNALVGIMSLFPIIIVGGFADLLGVGHVLTGIGISIIVLGIFKVFISVR